jgi:Domain of unknown function (DUF4157)
MATRTHLPAHSDATGAANRILQRRCACGTHTPSGEQCSECRKKRVQTKLTVGEGHDSYEREADRIADQVVASASIPASAQAPIHVQRFAPESQAGMEAPASVDRVLTSSGSALPRGVRGDMERGFGRDFSNVRVHTDSTAAQSARDVSARAYTVGNNVVFGANQFAPSTATGRRLLAHELTHVVQQSGGGSSAQRQVLQRDLGFEFQTENIIRTDKGRKFPRKVGKFLHKIPFTDKHGMELQTDTGSVAEFETHHFQKWSDLKAQIQSAVDVVTAIKKDPGNFAFNNEKALRSSGDLHKDEKLVVDITDKSFTAAIQHTEGFALEQYQSAVRQHERKEMIRPTIDGASRVMRAAKSAHKGKLPPDIELNAVRSLVEVILNYLLNAAKHPSKVRHVSPTKARFRLMARTNFASMFHDALSKEEQDLFREVVKAGLITKEVGFSSTDEVFPMGYWGHVGDLWALYRGGKIIAVAPENKEGPVDCDDKDARKAASFDTSSCGKAVPETQITIDHWLESIVKDKSDALSPAPRAGSDSMGAFPVRPSGSEKGLVVFETRGERDVDRSQPASKWIEYAEQIFLTAATCRERPTSSTKLIYDGTKPQDVSKCP